MYSVVLATMLMAGTSDVPQWGKGCHGCHGCWSCHGCHGSWSCHGCSGCYGCHGCSGCYGCWGCYGGCGGGYASGYGGYAGGYGGYGMHSWYGCSGCYGVFGCGGGYGGGVAAAPAGYGVASTVGNMPAGQAVAAAPAAPQVFQAQNFARPAPVLAQNEAAKVASKITVRLPENARLYVNDDQCPLTSDTRSFQTPQLKADKEYSYTLRAEVVRDGKTVSEVKRVIFKGGELVDVQFKELGPVRTVSR